MDNSEKKTEKEKPKQCPFDRNLLCEDCRLFVAFPGSEGQKVCTFIWMIGD